MSKYVLEIKNITKIINSVKILDNISLSLQPGEVRALVGENGSGKSVLIKILSGLGTPYSGTIKVNGQEVEMSSPKIAQDSSIFTSYEDINYLPDLNVAENIFVGIEPTKSFLGINIVDWKSIYALTSYYLKNFNLDISPNTKMKHLSLGYQKCVEIIRAFITDARLIILDEPMMFLQESEKARFFNIIKELKSCGKSVLLITQKLDEIRNIADTITVIHEGRVVTESDEANMSPEELARAMCGLGPIKKYPKLKAQRGVSTLQVSHLSYHNVLTDISFNIYEGEIVGLAGISGSGARTLLKTISGIIKPTGGSIYLYGRNITNDKKENLVRRGIGYISGIDPSKMLQLNKDFSFNLTITDLPRILKYSLIDKNRERALSTDYINNLNIRTRPDSKLSYLSGGNLRKVNIARCIFGNSKVLILDEPTHGVDTGAKVDIYNIINELVRCGASVLWLSSDYKELMGMCDRILVFKSGKISTVLNPKNITIDEIVK